MGVSYFVLALNEESASWLRENNLSLPSPLPQSRYPSLRELKATVACLDGYTAKERLSKSTNTLDIEVLDQGGYRAGWSTTIWATRASDKTRPPADDDTVKFFFHKGNPELAVLIVEKLVRVCGPLVMTPDVVCIPVLVTEGTDPRHVVDKWLKG